ncbi:MAG: antitoxin component YwqK of YwqJK toxin-antitoxin module [Flavobacteriales bacterium]|jgi:antitoxin component YwqK of YwqJK toxin-antitoxin module
MTLKILSLLFLLIPLRGDDPGKMYNKQFNEQGNMISEGWMMGNMKVKYWKFYHSNGNIASKGHFTANDRSGYWYFYDRDGNVQKEGHYRKGTTENWWIFYDLARQEKRKIQFQNNQKNGFCLIYKDRQLVKVEKYNEDQKQGEWSDLRSFRRDNPGVSLY